MATRERTPVGGGPNIAPGWHVGTVKSASHEQSAAGNKMLVWTFELADGWVQKHWTLLTSEDLHAVVVALGMAPAAVRLSEAVGRRCQLKLDKDGQFFKVKRVKPVEA